MTSLHFPVLLAAVLFVTCGVGHRFLSCTTRGPGEQNGFWSQQAFRLRANRVELPEELFLCSRRQLFMDWNHARPRGSHLSRPRNRRCHPAGHPVRVVSLGSLGADLGYRCSRTGAMADFEEPRKCFFFFFRGLAAARFRHGRACRSWTPSPIVSSHP